MGGRKNQTTTLINYSYMPNHTTTLSTTHICQALINYSYMPNINQLLIYAKPHHVVTYVKRDHPETLVYLQGLVTLLSLKDFLLMYVILHITRLLE